MHSVPAARLTFTILICMTLFYELYIAELSCLDIRRKFADNDSIYCLVSNYCSDYMSTQFFCNGAVLCLAKN